ncbi:glycosyl hydrolase 108 family protein [Phenylobacterium sp. SCN 70-31]|uniref:glycosyl hydrolase 108 family protein n=1 Tax=Phenylobacterium sp. SCN 70-31 TaxID=1660129 RepID=UPI00086DE089|nr:glycosyl hydrolase 108 family protein [Phenylobacterium sp. SCN 70-31]ODT88105.1 MAG: hypothetical protein ABS78_09440 [Phenylobacterium sp. SCN 70-31]
MARLPQSLDIGPARGARSSIPGVGQTDLGLGDLAEGLEAVSRAVGERDSRRAATLLQTAQAGYESGFAQRAAGYDGREPGFANFETSHFDAWAKGLTEDPKLGDGVRLALKRQLDDYRADAGRRAIGVEAKARGEIIADQRRAQSAQNISLGLTGFQASYGAGYQALADGYDGSTRDFTTRAAALFDEQAQAAAEAVPEADRPDFLARLAGLRPGLQAQAFEQEQRAAQAYLVESVKAARATTVNAVLGNPEAYALASSTSEELLAGLPKALRGPLLREYQGELAAARVQGLILKGDLDTATAELDSGRYDKVLPPAQKLQLTEAAKGRSARLAADLIEALRYGGDVDTDALKRAAAASGDPGLKAKADFAIEVGGLEGAALGSLTGGGSRKGFVEAAGFVIDALEGGAKVNPDDNGRGASKFGFTQAFHPDIDVKTLTRPQAVARARRYWTAVGGDSLPPGLAVVAFDAAFNQGPEKARRWLAESGGDVGAYLALREAEYRRLAKADPAKYGDDLPGWLSRLGKVRAEAARHQAFANVQAGLSSDPIKFALGGNGRAPLASVPPLPDTASGPAFRTALQGRLAVGDMMQRTYRAPLRMLTEGEAAFYKDMIDRDPTAAVDFAREAMAAVGPAAARSLLGEIGRQGEAGVTLHLAALATAGVERFADRAAQGLALKKQGATLDKSPEAAGIRARLDELKTVFAAMPELRLAAQATAEAALLADLQGGEARSAAYYVAGALGASTRNGRVYGGVSRLNGQPVLIPSWLAADQADDALDVLAARWTAGRGGPVHGDGTPVSAAEIGRARLEQLPDGRYRLLDRQGRVMAAPGGRAFTFDWDDARDDLANRLGAGAVDR